MDKNVVFIVLLSCVLSSCVDTGFLLYNEDGKFYDVYEGITVPILDTVVKVGLDFAINGMYNEEDIQKYSSSRPRLKYYFSIPTPILPTVKLNSFSFTDKKGDTIPSILYYRTVGEVLEIVEVAGNSWEKRDRVVNIIDSLPVIFTDSIKKEKKINGFVIFAECSQSYASIKTVYINYDIEVGDKRFVKQCKYTKKRYWDWRPKF